MSHPYINREIKCAFRWYRSPLLRHRRRTSNIDPDPVESCVPSLAFPARTILPFQALLAAGTTSITSWRVKNLAGTQVLNLDSSIPSLVLADYGGPARTIVCLEEPLRLDTIPEGIHEMEITTAEGEVIYSETFEWQCLKAMDQLANSDVGDGFTNWSYGTWLNRLAAKEAGSGPPSYDGEEGDKVATLGDNLLWTLTSGSWVSSTPANNSYWGVGPSSTFLVFTGGGWSSPVTPPVAFSPTPCWAGNAGVHWSYALPSDFTEGFVRIAFTVFYGSPITGTISVWAGDVLLGNYGQSQNGIGQEVVVWMEAGQSIEFRPNSSNFRACVLNTAFMYMSDGTDCMTMLRWSDCGDLGTVAYTIGNGNFANILYLRESGCLNVGAVYDPTPQITEGVQNDAQGTPKRDRRRKDVEWTLELASIPWHSMDAISELVVSSYRAIRVPWGGVEDEMITARIETTWEARNRVANGALIFQVDEATTAAGCCDLFERPCPEPCGPAAGVWGVHVPTIGERYLYTNGTIATFCGGDCGQPEDENGFNDIVQCAGRLATTTAEGYELMRWDGTQWSLAVGIFSATIEDEAYPLRIDLLGTIPSGYTGQYQASLNGTDWLDVGPAMSATEIEDGAVVDVPLGTFYLRLVARGYDCDLGASAAFAAPESCPMWVFSSNLLPNCDNIPILVTILALPYIAPTGLILPMVATGERVAIDYRINGGDWNSATIYTTGESYAIQEMYNTPGDTLEIRVTLTDRPWCDPVVSQEFSCPI